MDVDAATLGLMMRALCNLADEYDRYYTIHCPMIYVSFMSTVPIVCWKREAQNWSMMKPEKAQSFTGTTLKATGPVPADSRQ